MIDSFPFDGNAHRAPVFNCNRIQGLQIGWSDWYGSELDCQWIDVTFLDGTAPWKLDLEVNPSHILPESDYSNNLLSVSLECNESCDLTQARCLFGQCICNEDIESDTCYYISGIDELLGTQPSITATPSAIPSATSTTNPTLSNIATQTPTSTPQISSTSTPSQSTSISSPQVESDTEDGISTSSSSFEFSSRESENSDNEETNTAQLITIGAAVFITCWLLL